MINRKVFAISALFMVLISAGSAQASNQTQEEIPQMTANESLNLTQFQNFYNQNTEEVPSFVGSLIGDQTIALNLSNIEQDTELLEEDVIGIETNGKEISDIQWGTYNDTTLKIWINQEDIQQLMESQSPMQELKDMLKNGGIRYETYTITNKVKMTLMEIFLMF